MILETSDHFVLLNECKLQNVIYDYDTCKRTLSEIVAEQSLGEQFAYTCITLLRVIYEAFVGSVKALLPAGVLPRKSVAGQVVLITGSGSGLGRLMAIEFGKLDARLVLWDINEKSNLETKKMLEENGVEAHAYTVNVLKRDEIYTNATRVKSEVGCVDILINNAGIVNGRKFLESSDAAIERTMAINANALFFTTKAFLSEMLERNHGHLVTVASMAGKCGTAGLVDYCASKHAAVGFSESLAAELFALKKDGIHVTTVCPFFIDTGMFDGVRTKSPNLLPILQPQYVVDQIMEAILTNKETLLLPRFCYFVMFMTSFLPTKAINILADYYGTTTSMNKFVGRSQERE
ncbi:Epidermal retinol dehydrogenase 2 [Toxocara canis]|uniref:Epidermal retinol dehydrogenase 2 n=2 Tax=Toxocara canis TaxID=6265 RepID=A0A0B2VCJ7_TOXCA|nr:Epidermal retinol dehydrogenase 2 [Toxocara canis]VDM36670.1 unnamed protein product [Toxocara canis]